MDVDDSRQILLAFIIASLMFFISPNSFAEKLDENIKDGVKEEIEMEESEELKRKVEEEREKLEKPLKDKEDSLKSLIQELNSSEKVKETFKDEEVYLDGDELIDIDFIKKYPKLRKLKIKGNIVLSQVVLDSLEIEIMEDGSLYLDKGSKVINSRILCEGVLELESKKQIEEIFKENEKINDFSILVLGKNFQENESDDVEDKKYYYKQDKGSLNILEGSNLEIEFITEEKGQARRLKILGYDKHSSVKKLVNKGNIVISGSKLDLEKLEIINEGKISIKDAKLNQLRIDNYGSIDMDQNSSLDNFIINNQGNFNYYIASKEYVLKKGESKNLESNLEESEKKTEKKDKERENEIEKKDKELEEFVNLKTGIWKLDKDKTIDLYMEGGVLNSKVEDKSRNMDIIKTGIEKLIIAENRDVDIVVHKEKDKDILIDFKIINYGNLNIKIAEKFLSVDEDKDKIGDEDLSGVKIYHPIEEMHGANTRVDSRIDFKFKEANLGVSDFKSLKDRIDKADSEAEILVSQDIKFEDTIKIENKNLTIKSAKADGKKVIFYLDPSMERKRHFKVGSLANVDFKDIVFFGGENLSDINKAFDNNIPIIKSLNSELIYHSPTNGDVQDILKTIPEEKVENVLNKLDSKLAELENNLKDIKLIGGGVENQSGNVRFIKSNFIANEAIQGGAIYNNDGKIRFIGLTNFIYNGRNKNSNTIFQGGAIFNKGDMFFDGSTDFVANSSSLGGAIYNEGNMTSNKSIDFIGNTGLVNGGAIYDYKAGEIILQSSSDFIGNSTNGSGGAMFLLVSKKLVFKGTTNFTANKSSKNADGLGGAIYTEKDTEMIFDARSNFIGNESTFYAGAIYLNRNCKLDFLDITNFISNKVDGREIAVGGGLHIQGGAARFADISNFLYNSTTNYKGAGGFNESAGGAIGIRNVHIIKEPSILDFSAVSNFISNKSRNLSVGGNYSRASGGAINIEMQKSTEENIYINFKSKSNFIENKVVIDNIDKSRLAKKSSYNNEATNELNEYISRWEDLKDGITINSRKTYARCKGGGAIYIDNKFVEDPDVNPQIVFDGHSKFANNIVDNRIREEGSLFVDGLANGNIYNYSDNMKYQIIFNSTSEFIDNHVKSIVNPGQAQGGAIFNEYHKNRNEMKYGKIKFNENPKFTGNKAGVYNKTDKKVLGIEFKDGFEPKGSLYQENNPDYDSAHNLYDLAPIIDEDGLGVRDEPSYITYINTKGEDLEDIKDVINKLKYEKKTIKIINFIGVEFPIVDNYIIEGREYRFKCWNDSSNREYYPGEIYDTKELAEGEEKIFYTRWDEVKEDYKVKFIDTEGENIDLEDITNMDEYKTKEFNLKEGDILKIIDLKDRDIEKDGKLYRFRNWKIQDGSKETYDPSDSLKITKDMIFISQWDEIYKLTFINTEGENINLSDIKDENSYIIEYFKHVKGDTFSIPYIDDRLVEKDELVYRFRNWKTEDGGVEIYYPSNICRPTGNMTFISQWDKVTGDNYYQIRFIDPRKRIERDNIGGKEASDINIPIKANIRKNGAGEDGSLEKDVFYEDHQYECTSNRDWTFLYWEDDYGKIYKPGQQLTLIEDLILTARWKNTTNYQVVFKYNYNEKTKTYDDEKTLEDEYNVGDFYKMIEAPSNLKGNLRGWIHDKEGSFLEVGDKRKVYIYDINPIVYREAIFDDEVKYYTISFTDRFGKNNLDPRKVLQGHDFIVPGGDCLECVQGSSSYDFDNWDKTRLDNNQASLRNITLLASKDNIYKPGDKIENIQSDINLDSRWKEKPYYNVIFIDEEDKNKIGNKKVYIDQYLFFPSPEIKEFKLSDKVYEFSHFKDSKNNKYKEAEKTYLRENFKIEEGKVSKDIVIYLKWKELLDSKPEDKDPKPDGGGGGGGSNRPGEDKEPDEDREPDKDKDKPKLPETDIEKELVDEYKKGDKKDRDELLGLIIEEKVDYKLNKEDHFNYIKGYTDNTVRPMGNISREEVAEIIFRIMDDEFRDSVRTRDSSFIDVEKDRWSQEAISTLEKIGIIEGYGENNFKPLRKITRAEIAKIVGRFTDTVVYPTEFKDIVGHWAEDYINSIEEEGWIKGYKDGSFKPDDDMTRAEFVTLINSLLERYTKVENMLENRREFPDLKKDSWYYDQLHEAINSHDYSIENGEEVWIRIK